MSFCKWKFGVHLGFEHSFLTRNGLNTFRRFRALNRVYDSLLEISICLVSYPKISAFFILWFRNYRSRSGVNSQGV